jgi:CheY-like chemotaxis protein
MKPDLILLNIMMELTDGWETPGKIKADPVTRDITVLMFSVMKITPEGAEEHCLSIEDFIKTCQPCPAAGRDQPHLLRAPQGC